MASKTTNLQLNLLGTSAADKTKLFEEWRQTINGEDSTSNMQIIDQAYGNVMNAIGGKADKISSPTNGNFVSMDSNGNLTNSGKKASDFVTSQSVSGKADKVTGATNGNFAALNSSGNLVDSGHKHSDYLTQHQDISGKADKVSGATNGNFAALDSNGNITDSGKKTSDFATSQTVSGKADKVGSATSGNFAALDANGNLTDSGHKHSDYLTSGSVSGKADKVTGATSGNFAGLDASGNITDSGKKASDFATQQDLSGKQDALTFDTAPTTSSTNPVTSGGIKTALDGKVAKPTTNPNGTSGQVLQTNGDGTTSWVNGAAPSAEQVGEAVADWLNDHPDATTTVADGSITQAKLDSTLQGKVNSIETLVSSVTESEGTVTITKKNGTSTSFVIPQGLAFDSGYCAVDQTDGKTYLHLTKAVESGGQTTYEDIEGFDPIELPDSGMVFDSGRCVQDPNTDRYYLHLTMNGTDLSTDIFTPFELPAGGGGGGGGVSMRDLVKTSAARNGGSAPFAFTAVSADYTDITVMWYVNNALVTSAEGESGTRFTFDAGPYLRESSTNIVSATILSEGGGSLTPQWVVTTTAFSLSWGAAINPITLYTENENIFVTVNVSAQGDTTNSVTIAVGDDNEQKVTRSVTGSTTLTVELDKTWFETGENTVTASMVSGLDPTDKADDISYVALWAYGTSTPIVAFAEDELSGVQYDTIPIRYFAYNPNSETATCTIQVGEEDPRTVIADQTMQTFSYIYNGQIPDPAPGQDPEPIELTVTLSCGSGEDTMTLYISKNEYDIGMITGDSLRYILDPAGHSNNDADRTQFGNLAFSENFDWANGGFHTDENGAPAFVVKKGNRVTVPRSLFSDNDQSGKVIDISFKITNSDQYDAVAMQDLNNGGTKGLILRANEGELRLNNATGQMFRYCEDNRVDMSIYVEEITSQRVAMIWLDGIPSKVDPYSASTLVHNENNAVIGSDHCDVWIYMIRAYNTSLSEREMVQNYISLGNTTTEKVQRYTRNAIYNTGGKIAPSELHSAALNLTLIEIEAARMTTSKSDPVPAKITITDGNTKLVLPAATGPSTKDGCIFKVQGTSSAAYGRSSYNMDIDFKNDPGKQKYKISETSIPVNYLNIKVNVASSENANNVNAVDWYNTYQPYKIEADSTPGVRDTVEAKPCAVFFTNTNNTAVWFSSQLVQPNETVLYAMGDLCNSKKNLAVFGEDGEGEHPTMCCVEVSGNDTEPERFLTDQGYEYNHDAEAWRSFNGYNDKGEAQYIKHFEWRMAPSDDNEATAVAAWESAVSWVVSTIGNATKFKNEVSDYFAIDSLLYHFLMIEFFAAYDDVSKNTFYSYDYDEDEDKYLWNIKKAYDWDTILAADNDGKPLGDYGIDYDDTVDGTPNGRTYFNAVDNTIWTNIKAAFQDELSAMYTELRSEGTWDGAGVIAKWDNYQHIRPHAAMVHDAYIKYIYPYKTVIDANTGYDSSYLPRMQGSKTYWRRQFMTYQPAYMDGKYYRATESEKSGAIAFRTNGESTTKSFTVKCYAKTYVTAIADTNKIASMKVEAGDTVTFSNVTVGNNTTFYFAPARLIQYIRPLNETKNSTFVSANANKLMEVVLGGSVANGDWAASESLSVPSAVLKELNIRNLTQFSSPLDLSANVELETLDCRGTNTGIVTLAPYAPLESIQLNACSGFSGSNLNDVETFSMANGNNLIYVSVDNPEAPPSGQADTRNLTVSNAMVDYLMDAFESGGTGVTRNVRMTNVDWTLEDTDLLNYLLDAGSISDSGVTGPAPCVLTGSVYVPVVRSEEYAAYEAAWPGVVHYGHLQQQYRVTFYDWDGETPIYDINGRAYVQMVDAGQNTYDPINEGEVDTPTRAQDARYSYTFSGWDRLPTGVTKNETVTATYTSIARKYTVQWYNGVGSGDGTLLETRSNVEYGSSIEPTNDFPTFTGFEPSVYYVFTGWDRSTGYITGDTKVHATWDYASLPDVSENLSLNEMTWAQRSAVAKNDKCDKSVSNDNYWEPGEPMDFRIGRDFDFDSGSSSDHGYVESITLIDDSTWFGGGAPMIFNGRNGRPDIRLFDGSIPRWTLAIDYEFADDGGVLVGCDEATGNKGFRVRRISNYANMTWGNGDMNVAYRYQRAMLVLRYNSEKSLRAINVHNDGSVSSEFYYSINTSRPESNIQSFALQRDTNMETNAPLTFGGVGFTDGTDASGSRAKGWIHWAKIWMDDLGPANGNHLAAMPHLESRFRYTAIRYMSIDGSTASGGFFSDTLLPRYGYMHNSSTNVGGWRDCHRRQWMNGQYLESLPTPLQSIIKEVSVNGLAGGGTPSVPRRDIQSSTDKIYIPCLYELFPASGGTSADAVAYLSECDDRGRRIPWFAAYDSSRGQTHVNQTRQRFLGFILPSDTNYCVVSSDPTTSTVVQTVHHGKTVWVNTNTSQGYLYVNGDYVSKHKTGGGRLMSDSSNINANGADSDGGTGGKWILLDDWWSRSPVTTSNANYNCTSTYGQGSASYANSTTHGLAPAFSI